LPKANFFKLLNFKFLQIQKNQNVKQAQWSRIHQEKERIDIVETETVGCGCRIIKVRRITIKE